MKTLPVLLLLAALSALLVLPVALEILGSLFLAAGLTCILAADYSRSSVRDLSAAASAVVPVRSRTSRVHLRLAA